MTESEAKAILERDLNCLKQNKALPDSIEAMQIAINALEKQIPKKPIIREAEDSFGYVKHILCPNCEKADFGYERPCFCRICGQAIDWEEN